MTTTILVVGDDNIQSEKFIDAAEKKFDKPQFITYFRKETADSKRITDGHNVREVIYDDQLQQMCPENPDEDYLTEFEEEFGSGILWRCVIGDSRITKSGKRNIFYDKKSVFDHQELLSNIESRIKRIKKLFDSFDIDFMFISGTDIKVLISCIMCDSEEIPYYFVGHTHISGRYSLKKGDFTLSENIFDPFELKNTYEDAIQNPENYPFSEAQNFIDNVRDGEPLYTLSQLQPSNLTNEETDGEQDVTSSTTGRRVLDTLKFAGRFVNDGIKHRNRNYYRDTPYFKTRYKTLLAKLRAWYLNKIFDYDSFDSNKDYVYFPLQAQPEVSLMLRARYYTHLDAVINNVAQSLPIGMEVYVNEHPHMRNARWPTFYDRVRQLPNVRMLPMDLETRTVIQNAAVVICVNTTTGLEAAIHNTPVLTLGNPDYSMIDGVTPIADYENIPVSVKDSIQNGVNMRSVESYIAASLAIGKQKNDVELYRKSCNLISDRLHG